MRLFGNLLKRPRRPFCQPLPARRACCQRQRRCHAASARCRSRRRSGRRSRCWSQRVRPGRAAPARALQSTPAAGHAGSACRPRSTPASAGAAGERRPNTPLLCTRPLAFVIGSTREPKFWQRSIVTRHLALAAALSWRASMLPLGAGAGRMREERFYFHFFTLVLCRPHLVHQRQLPLELLAGTLAAVEQVQNARHVALGKVQDALGGRAVAAWGGKGGGPGSLLRCASPHGEHASRSALPRRKPMGRVCNATAALWGAHQPHARPSTPGPACWQGGASPARPAS